MARNKTDNFLRAIKKYAKAQSTLLQTEVKQLKSERIKEAEETARRDSERLIKDKLHEKRNHEMAVLAKKTQEGQKELFVERTKMTEEIFSKASDKLIDFTKTDEYTQRLCNSAKAIAELFGDRDCVLYVNERDLGTAESFRDFFAGKVEAKADKTIKIGGIKGYCPEMAIIADETLDSKLEAQREWFIENATLSVL